ncbi:MAG: DUF2834 domain-containing protein [Aquiluna sp.]|nr:DUF2834 domain-containing protein [Aquiluna sp.]MCF8545740.1 DUF2834 domain-containing protein [Aquiluna sp.]
MSKKFAVRSNIYFVFAGLGLVTAMVLNGIASVTGQNYMDAWFGSAVDWVLSVDLLIVALAVVTFMLVEAKRLKMKRVWLYFLLSGVTAMAFTFPLFMAMRERKLAQIAVHGGKLERFEFDNHKVDVWVPKDVDENTPILVMHDGRNVFSETDSFSGTTWGVLPALKEVRGKAPVIVAVWGLSDDTRLRELGPQSAMEKNPDKCWEHVPDDYFPTGKEPMGDAYVSLLADAIVPFVQDRYGIKPSVKNTAVMGASMGGLMSMYAMGKRPDIFGTAICFSTHWVFGTEFMVQELTDLLPEPGAHRVWTDSGTIELDENYPPFHKLAVQRLREKGYAEPRHLVGAIYPNTGHHESYWARRVAEALNWWLEAPPRS